MWNRWLILPCALAVLALTACSEDDGGDGGTSIPSTAGTAVAVATTGIDTDAILGSVDDVRALIERNAAGLESDAIADVDYADDRLTVTLAPSQDDLDVAGLESACEEVFSAIALPDLSIAVEKSDGSQTAECGSAA